MFFFFYNIMAGKIFPIIELAIFISNRAEIFPKPIGDEETSINLSKEFTMKLKLKKPMFSLESVLSEFGNQVFQKELKVLRNTTNCTPMQNCGSMKAGWITLHRNCIGKMMVHKVSRLC